MLLPLQVTKYGSMYSMYLSTKPTIVLNNMQIAKEAFTQNGVVFSGRPFIPLMNWITDGYGIVMFTNGNSWKQQHHFALHMLHNFDLGNKTVEECVAKEAQYLIGGMLKHEDAGQRDGF